MSTKKETVNVGDELKAEAEKRYPIKRKWPDYKKAIKGKREAFITGAQWQSSQRDEEMEEAKLLLRSAYDFITKIEVSDELIHEKEKLSYDIDLFINP